MIGFGGFVVSGLLRWFFLDLMWGFVFVDLGFRWFMRVGGLGVLPGGGFWFGFRWFLGLIWVWYNIVFLRFWVC